MRSSETEKKGVLMITLLVLLLVFILIDIYAAFWLGLGMVVYFLPEIILIAFIWWLFKGRRK